MPLLDIDTVKSGIEEFKYWKEAFGIIGTVLLWLKRTRQWLTKVARWLYSKWPYTIIRQQAEEIEKLKGKKLSEQEVLVLQSLWALGIEFSVTQARVMEILSCKSQKASYLIQKLSDGNYIYYDSREAGYKLNTRGQKYILDHKRELSIDEFKKVLEGNSKPVDVE